MPPAVAYAAPVPLSGTFSTFSAPRADLAFPSAADVCEFVDDLNGDAAGELLFDRGDGAPDGALFVERGRVCWAAARGLARRLTDILAASANLDAPAMELLYAACKKQRAPLGEFLVDAGIVTADELRSALLLHTAESLNVLSATETRAQWRPRRAGGYCSRFTFSTTELLSRTFAESHRALAERASRELAGSFGEGDCAAAFIRSPSRSTPDPIAVHGAVPCKVEALLRLGSWAVSSLDVSSSLHDDDAFVATVFEGGALVAWKSGATIVAGRTSMNGPARLLNRRARARREEASSHGRL